MARDIYYVMVIVSLLASVHLGTSAPDWVNDLTRDINRMTQDINAQVQRYTQNLHSQIEQTVQNSLAEANKVIENLPRDEHGRIISNNGNVISISSGNGISRTIMSGRTPGGEPYVRDIEEQYKGNVLYHNETSFNPNTRATERIRWKLDLGTPGAKPEILTDE